MINVKQIITEVNGALEWNKNNSIKDFSVAAITNAKGEKFIASFNVAVEQTSIPEEVEVYSTETNVSFMQELATAIEEDAKFATTHEHTDFIPIPPGETIKEQLDDKELSIQDFAAAMEMDDSDVAALLTGDTELTVDIAKQLEHVLGVPSNFWMSLEGIYRNKLAMSSKETKKKLAEELHQFATLITDDVIPSMLGQEVCQKMVDMCSLYTNTPLMLGEHLVALRDDFVRSEVLHDEKAVELSMNFHCTDEARTVVPLTFKIANADMGNRHDLWNAMYNSLGATTLKGTDATADNVKALLKIRLEDMLLGSDGFLDKINGIGDTIMGLIPKERPVAVGHGKTYVEHVSTDFIANNENQCAPLTMLLCIAFTDPTSDDALSEVAFKIADPLSVSQEDALSTVSENIKFMLKQNAATFSDLTYKYAFKELSNRIDACLSTKAKLMNALRGE